ncbi:MAG: hypothetical protein NPIRA04_12380 [Nitrospirales bacterium]|nr:MAG: hypothetical protein NPIRA04_12380 [Nitrospirales bacterium]
MIRLGVQLISILGLILGMSLWAQSEDLKPKTMLKQPVATVHHPTPRLLDGFGMSAMESRGQVLVGAPYANGAGQDSGQTYLFNARGQLVHTYDIPIGTTGALFGQSVALTEQRVIVGAPHGRDAVRTQTGAVYVFDRKTTALRFTLDNPQPTSGVFGHVLAVQGNRILVGDPQASTSTVFRAGAAYLFDETTGVLQRTLHSMADDAKLPTQFGHAVALVGPSIFVSAPFGHVAQHEAGVVYLYNAKTGNLVRTFKPPNPSSSLMFGWALAANARVVLIGALGFHDRYREEGVAYLFEVQSGDLLHILHNPSPTERARFGQSVALLEDYLVVAAPGDRIHETGKIEGGVVYVFDQDTGKLLHRLGGPLPSTGASDVFGEMLFAYGKRLVVGAPFGGTGAELDAGLIYRFDMH